MYGNYRGQCIGRLLHFLYEYNFNGYDIVIFHGDTKTITLRDKLVAEYSWDKTEDGKETDIPTFVFHGEDKKWWEDIQIRNKARVVGYDRILNQAYKRSDWEASV